MDPNHEKPMKPRRSTAWVVGSALVLALSAGLPYAAQAQARDFLLRTPRATLGFRTGYALATASSEIFDFSREQLTLTRRDFDAMTFGAQLAISATPRLDVALDVSVADAERKSEFRDWVGSDDLPIEQTTEFYRLPVTLGVKAYLRDRGRGVGRFAWVPERWAPYVGAGAGWVWYRFEQDGEWVDYESLDIFRDRFTTSGSTPTVHVYGGADWSLGPAVVLSAEARYGWARAEMGGSFVGFDALDLSGLQGTLGISLRF